MDILPKSIKNLIARLSELPGIGEKTAERLTFYLLKSHPENVRKLGEAILNLKNRVKVCSVCFNLTESDPCLICSDSQRDQGQICVVEDALDIVALEKIRSYNGTYHVLGGVISPVEDIGPENLNIRQLVDRVKKGRGKVKEVILATNPNMEGEATAMYIAKLIKPYEVKVTRIARGLPTGAELEYADEITLQRALEGRKEY